MSVPLLPHVARRIPPGDHAVVLGGGMHSSRGQEGQALSGDVPRDSRHTDAGGCPDPVVVRGHRARVFETEQRAAIFIQSRIRGYIAGYL